MAHAPSLNSKNGIAGLSKLNINIGILGHVDSGKTSIARALSTHFSTASIDKSPQEKERGITIELGFSCFTVPTPRIPAALQKELPRHIQELQFTLVDCPGHASLIRTIIGGAQIIDFMLLVIDVNKGVQTQTAECLVLGEILTRKTQLIVVLNKMDLFYKSVRQRMQETDGDDNDEKSAAKSMNDVIHEKLDKKISAIRKTFKKTKFGKTVQIVCITANRDGNQAPGQNAMFDHNIDAIHEKSDHIQTLIDAILSTIQIPDRKQQSLLPFLAAVDHCFSIKGQGTILTSTILQGSLSLQQMIEIPSFREQRKVRNIQMYKQNLHTAIAGDRVSISIAQFAAKHMNRGLVCAPNTVPLIHRVIARCDRIRFFKESIKSGAKFHITIGHSTTIAQIQCFRSTSAAEQEQHCSHEKYMPSYVQLYEAEQLAKEKEKRKKKAKKQNAKEEKEEEKTIDDARQNVVAAALDWAQPFVFDADYLHLSQLDNPHLDDASRDTHIEHETYVLLTFSKPVCAAKDSLLIGSRFDNADLRKDVCRLAFTGKIVAVLPPPRMVSVAQWQQELNSGSSSSSSASDATKHSSKDKIDAELQRVRIYRPKMREGFVDKFVDGYTAIGTSLFQKGTDISLSTGLKVELDTRFHEVGVITGLFGDSGNFYIKFENKVKRKRSEKWKPKVLLKSKKYLFQKYSRMVQ